MTGRRPRSSSADSRVGARRAGCPSHDQQKSAWEDEELGQRLDRGDESRSREFGAEWSNFSEGGVSWRLIGDVLKWRRVYDFV